MATKKEIESKIAAEFVRENLVYVPETGMFFWKKQGPGRMMGRQLGTKVWPGYLTMKLDGNIFMAHRLAWMHFHGVWPDGQIDHIDGNKANNAIINLRVATPSQNSAGRRSHRRIAPSRGVMPHGVGFVARIHHAGKRHYLGYFPTLEEARAAYEAAAKDIHGEFARAETAKPEYRKADACEICGCTSGLRPLVTRLRLEPRGTVCGGCYPIARHNDPDFLHKVADYLDRIGFADDNAEEDRALSAYREETGIGRDN